MKTTKKTWGLRKDSRGIIPNRTGIDKRPLIVEKHKGLGALEVDLMMGKNHIGDLLVIVDRASLQARAIKSKEINEVKKQINSRLKNIKHHVKTITFDNDKAFSKHEAVAKFLKAKTYFTRPYTSQDKGSFENRIGVIRRFFPKKTDLTKVGKERVKEVESLINNRPVRKFNYQTPNQVFSHKNALIT